MVAAKQTFFTKFDSGGQNGEGIRVWKAANNQHGTCVVGDMVSGDPADKFDHKATFVFFAIKDAIVNPDSWGLVLEMDNHKFWKLYTSIPGYVCPGIAVTLKTQTPKGKEYCCFKEEFLTTGVGMHRSEQSIGEFWLNFQLAERKDENPSVIPTEHFIMRETGKETYMVIDDGEKVVMDDNFDYDPARPLDIIEITTFENVCYGELENSLYTGAEKKFSFWKASEEGLFSLGTTFKMGEGKPGAVLLLKANTKYPNYDTVFRRPDSFNKVFSFDTYTIWTLNCPAHYRALGVAVTPSTDFPDDVYCIKARIIKKTYLSQI